MSDATASTEEKPAQLGTRSVILAAILALSGAAGGFYLTRSGLISIGGAALTDRQYEDDSTRDTQSTASETSNGNTVTRQPGKYGNQPKPLGNIAFVAVDPITISLDENLSVKHLRFRSQLEVNADYKREVEKVLPRVTDVMNSYLRALELEDLTGPLALIRLRAQLLRRVQVVTGEGRVGDLLVMEFVLN
jgi:flagellar FliL protein